ncbi:MAG: hypothetical protein ONB05_03120 [candidate division KSB1 bacterium]|nr:hypothetical protein [candidate division KSB1 bacterium]
MLKISDELASYVTALFPEETVEDKLKRLIENELIRRLAQYQHTVRTLEMKYHTDFETFKANNLVAQRGYSFEVESDFCDWEMALDGIKTVERKLQELREKHSDN